jgi:serine/threonine protein phosphatase PrpC
VLSHAGRTLALLADGAGTWEHGYEAAQAFSELVRERFAAGELTLQTLGVELHRLAAQAGGPYEGDKSFDLVAAWCEAGVASVFTVGGATALVVRDGRVLAHSSPDLAAFDAVAAGSSEVTALTHDAGLFRTRRIGGANERWHVEPTRRDFQLEDSSALVLGSAGLLVAWILAGRPALASSPLTADGLAQEASAWHAIGQAQTIVVLRPSAP